MTLILSSRSFNLMSQDKIGQGGLHMPITQSIPTRRIYVSPVLVFVRPDEFCTPKTELNIYFCIGRKGFLYVKSHLIRHSWLPSSTCKHAKGQKRPCYYCSTEVSLLLLCSHPEQGSTHQLDMSSEAREVRRPWRNSPLSAHRKLATWTEMGCLPHPAPLADPGGPI